MQPRGRQKPSRDWPVGERGQLRRPGRVTDTAPSVQPLKGAPPLFLVSFLLEKNDLQKRTSTHTEVGLNETKIGSRHIRQSKYK